MPFILCNWLPFHTWNFVLYMYLLLLCVRLYKSFSLSIAANCHNDLFLFVFNCYFLFIFSILSFFFLTQFCYSLNAIHVQLAKIIHYSKMIVKYHNVCKWFEFEKRFSQYEMDSIKSDSTDLVLCNSIQFNTIHYSASVDIHLKCLNQHPLNSVFISIDDRKVFSLNILSQTMRNGEWWCMTP